MFNGSSFLWVLRVFQTVGAQIKAVGPRKWSDCSNSSIISVIKASKLNISEIFTPECVYLRPNVYNFTQMCIFMTNLIKFSGVQARTTTILGVQFKTAQFNRTVAQTVPMNRITHASTLKSA